MVPRNLLLELFDNRCIRYPSFDNIFKAMKAKIGTIATAEHLHKWFSDAECQIYECTRIINREPQYNTWVFSDIKSMLIRDGFAVEPEYPNKEIVPAVNEYSTSCTDCVIFHPSTASATINILNLHIDDENSDVEIEQPGLPTNARMCLLKLLRSKAMR